MSSLKLNEIEMFKEFYGKNIDQMPKLLGEGRTPLSTAGLMERKLEVLTASEDVKGAWWNNYFSTGDAVIYHPDGRFKVVTGNNAKPFWKELNPKSKLSMRALVLPDGMYDKFNGESFTREEIKRYGIAEKMLTMEEAKRNPIWKALAGGDQTLLDSYVDAVFKKAEKNPGYDKIMGVWLSQPQEVILGRVLVLSNDYDGLYGDNLDSLGRFVGVAPEAL